MIRNAIPDVAITTDIIVGFPGETEEEFEETLTLVERARYDAAYMFQYSPRPMTAAAEMDGHLPKHVVQHRFDRLVALQEDISLERNLAAVGGREEVIVEGVSKRDADRLTGRTRTNKLVHFSGAGLDEGSRAHVDIVAAHRHHLEGELAGPAVEPARRSLSLPLVTAAAPGCASCS